MIAHPTFDTQLHGKVIRMTVPLPDWRLPTNAFRLKLQQKRGLGSYY